MADDGSCCKIADVLMREWARANIAGESERLVSLYAPCALFFGSRRELRRGTAEIDGYFSAIPRGGVKDVVFSERQAAWASADTIVCAAFVDFHLNYAGIDELRKWRILLTLVRGSDGRWLIAGHHAAPREWA